MDPSTPARTRRDANTAFMARKIAAGDAGYLAVEPDPADPAHLCLVPHPFPARTPRPRLLPPDAKAERARLQACTARPSEP